MDKGNNKTTTGRKVNTVKKRLPIVRAVVLKIVFPQRSMNSISPPNALPKKLPAHLFSGQVEPNPKTTPTRTARE